jgi:hypothetical protein
MTDSKNSDSGFETLSQSQLQKILKASHAPLISMQASLSHQSGISLNHGVLRIYSRPERL